MSDFKIGEVVMVDSDFMSFKGKAIVTSVDYDRNVVMVKPISELYGFKMKNVKKVKEDSQ